MSHEPTNQLAVIPLKFFNGPGSCTQTQRLTQDYLITSSSAIAERPRCRVDNFGQKWKTVFCRQYRTIFNHFEVSDL